MAWQRLHETDCGQCPRDRRDLGLLPPDCRHCAFPGIFVTNLAAWEVLQVTGGALFDGMGGVNLTNAREVAAALGHPWDRAMMTKISQAAMVKIMKAEEIPGFLEKLKDGD